MARYTFHYLVEPANAPYQLNCGFLTRAIYGRVPHGEGEMAAFEPAPAIDYSSDDEPDSEDDAVVPAAAPAAPPPAPVDGAEADPIDLYNPELWESVARFQWALKSDRLVAARAVATLIADIQADGELEGVRRAFRRLTGALVAAHPALAGADRRALVQLVALGNEMATAAAQSPDLFEFVKNELQPVNLAALLRI